MQYAWRDEKLIQNIIRTISGEQSLGETMYSDKILLKCILEKSRERWAALNWHRIRSKVGLLQKR
jgi:hypothetical protein